MTADSLAESDTVVRSAEKVEQGWTPRGGGGGGAEPQVDMLQNFLVSLPGCWCWCGLAGRAGATLSISSTGRGAAALPPAVWPRSSRGAGHWSRVEVELNTALTSSLTPQLATLVSCQCSPCDHS